MFLKKIKHPDSKVFFLCFLLIANTSVYSMGMESDYGNAKKSHMQFKETHKNECLEKEEESRKSKVSKYKRFEDLILFGLVGASLGGVASAKLMRETLEFELQNELNGINARRILMNSREFGNTINRGGVNIIIGGLF